ncbi:hypothetical protein JKP88DRAFT_348144 [Tribonema minus]|uniref:Pentatricopeptide repeat-containing protein n=1 Tax=Tribonema minus TaxID=303371 RepID=A0A836CGW7_9STRA|nr:hypothetical protein JKP88DRAFT_348144 [Tribonema minus]
MLLSARIRQLGIGSRVLAAGLKSGSGGGVPNALHFTTAISACAAAGSSASASDIWRLMLSQDKPAQRWAALLDIIGAAGQADQMLAMYREMRASGHRPDVFVLNIMLAHAGGTDSCSVAEPVWGELQQYDKEADEA